MKYTEKQFQHDLKELNKMLDQFNTQKHGGKLKSKGKLKHKGGVVSKEGDRTFRLHTIEGKTIKSDEGGNYKITAGVGSPENAARKAFRMTCLGIEKDKQHPHKNKVKKNSGGCSFKFTIIEKTRGSNKKVYGPYLGKRIKLKTPEKKTFKGKTFVKKYEYKITDVDRK